MSVTSARLEVGKSKIDQLMPGASELIREVYQDVSPEMGRWILEFAFGDVASRDDMNPRDRIISNLSALICLGGGDAQLKMQVSFAATIGMSRKEIVGVFLNVVPICGFMRAQNALLIVANLLPEEEGEG